jgi:hypothetical protein
MIPYQKDTRASSSMAALGGSVGASGSALLTRQGRFVPWTMWRCVGLRLRPVTYLTLFYLWFRMRYFSSEAPVFGSNILAISTHPPPSFTNRLATVALEARGLVVRGIPKQLHVALVRNDVIHARCCCYLPFALADRAQRMLGKVSLRVLLPLAVIASACCCPSPCIMLFALLLTMCLASAVLCECIASRPSARPLRRIGHWLSLYAISMYADVVE